MNTRDDDLEQRFVEAVSRVIDTASHTGHNVYWLLDGSALPGAWLDAHIKDRHAMDLLQGASAEHPGRSTPILVSEPGNGSTGAAPWCELHRFMRHACAASLLASPMELDELQAALRPRTRVLLPGGMQAMLRWFDTRVAAALPHVLTGPQLAALTAGTSQWHYLDRWGDLQALQARAMQPTPLEVPIVLTQEQEDALVNDGLVDAVIDHLLTQTHPTLMPLAPPEQFELVQPLVLRARAAGAEDPPVAADLAAQWLLEAQTGQ